MPSAVESPLVSQMQLAGIFGVKTDTIRAWERMGCPVEHRGGRGLASAYRPADVIRWREEQATLAAAGDVSKLDLNEARRRKTVAEAALAEIDLARARGEIAEVSIMTRELGNALAATLARLMAVGAKLAPTLEFATDAASRKNMIDDAIAEAVHDISSPDFSFFGSPEGDDPEGAAGDVPGEVPAT